MAILDNEKYRSYPAINQSLLKNIGLPWLFKMKESEAYDKSTKSLDFGTFQDMLIDDDPEIWDKFIAIDVRVHPNFKSLIEKCFKPDKEIEECKVELLEEYDKCFTNKYKEETRFNYIKRNGGAYWNSLNKIGKKIIITMEQKDIAYNNLNQIKPVIENCLHKVCLTAHYNGIEIKGELDDLRINRLTKTWNVEDTKTSSEIYEFPKNSILPYRYDFQMAFYEKLVELNAEELDIVGYAKTPGIWNVISNTKISNMKRYLNPYNAHISGKAFGREYIGVDRAIELYKFHKENNIWDKTYSESCNGYETIYSVINYD